jgi:hypothetical protein
MTYEGPRIHYPTGWRERARRAPLVARIGAMVAAFALLAPVAYFWSGGAGEELVAAGAGPQAPAAAAPVQRRTPATAPKTTAKAKANVNVNDNAYVRANVKAKTKTRSKAAAPASAPPRRVTSSTSASTTSSVVRRSVQTRHRVANDSVSSAGHTTPWHPPRTTTSTASVKRASPPPTAAPRRTTTTTTPRRTSPPTTKAPPPTTAKVHTYTGVEAIIRSVWPASLADHAVFIANRESHLIPTSHNYCCYGIFALYFNQLPASLRARFGLTTASQLYDPLLNSRVAYALYQIAGWKPWAL